MLGVLVNALAILAGGSVGLLAKKGIPEKITNAIMTAIALCVIYIGVSGMLKGENTLVLIVSMVLGTAVGTLLDLDGRIERLGGRLQRRFQRGGRAVIGGARLHAQIGGLGRIAHQRDDVAGRNFRFQIGDHKAAQLARRARHCNGHVFVLSVLVKRM